MTPDVGSTSFDVEVIRTDGTIVDRRGVTDASGLFFLGLPWQHTRGSALIGFVDDDAAFIAGRIDSHLGDPAGLVGTERT